MSIESAINRAIHKKEERGWDKWPALYWAIDLHGVVVTSTYVAGNHKSEYLPGALEVLAKMTAHPRHKLILYTSSYVKHLQEIWEDLYKHGVVFNFINRNPECPNTDFGCFDTKFYFDILIDDKAGFDADRDWFTIKYKLMDLGLYD